MSQCTKLVETLCAENHVSLINVDDNINLGECVGLCKTDQERKPVVQWLRNKNLRPTKDVTDEHLKCKKKNKENI